MAKIPFSIKHRKKIESGEYKVETRSGDNVKILSTEAYDDFPIIYRVDGIAEPQFANSNGRHISDEYDSLLDLFIITPEPELTEFEKKLFNIVGYAISLSIAEPKKPTSEFVKEYSAKLLSLAREQFIKDGYVIEKKAFHDAVEKVDPDVMKEVSENVDMKEALRTEYEKGRADALKDLPRWKKIGRGNNYSAETKFTINGRYLEMNDTLNVVYEVPLSALEKLPRFKED